MVIKYLILTILILSCQNHEIIESEHECAARILIRGYEPIKIEDEGKIPVEVSKKLEKEFRDSLGAYLADRINFTLGFEYDLKEINKNHSERVKNYQWKIPRFYLNYAIEDSKLNITYCIRIEISDKGKIIGRNVPKLLDKFQNKILLSQDKAITEIRNSLSKKELKKIKFESSIFIYNWRKNVFEWEFGQDDKVWIEAFENGVIRKGNFTGTREL